MIFPLCWEIKNAPNGESIDHTFLGAFERRTAQQSASDNRQVDDVEHGHVASIHRRLCQVLDKGVDESLCHLSHLPSTVLVDTIAVRADVIITSVSGST